MALTDPLTKLANRRHFENQFDYLLRQAKRGNELALIMLDIDHFKSFNDTYGHDKGDEALVIVAEVLQTYLREMDVVGRTGGEEFCVLVPGGNDKAVEIAERLRKKLSLVPFVKPITISLGIAYYGIDGTSIHELTKSSDKALYWAKEHGRNQVVEYCKVKDGDE
ncbi:GGDEF domain-containing protein [Bacillus cereus]